MAIAGVFPGQGSQSIGMLAELADAYVEVKNTFTEASDTLGKDLWRMAQEGPETDLNNTENTQPVMLAAGVAVWRVWLSQGGCQPVAMAGHSLGEYSALVASEKLTFTDAVALVQKRATLMQQAVPAGEGAMAAILGLEDESVLKVCADASAGESIVEAVNFNSPGQVVIAGSAGAVDKAIEAATEAGAKRAIKLAVSVPSHCALMKPAADQLAESLATTTFANTAMPVLHNVDTNDYAEAEAIREALGQQLYRPVRWVDTVNRFANDFGADKLIEFGPGKVLFGLNRRINKGMTPICISDVASLEKALAFCAE
jgi:[acyl-carrier-protein] S-malonyltransferase